MHCPWESYTGVRGEAALGNACAADQRFHSRCTRIRRRTQPWRLAGRVEERRVSRRRTRSGGGLDLSPQRHIQLQSNRPLIPAFECARLGTSFVTTHHRSARPRVLLQQRTLGRDVDGTGSARCGGYVGVDADALRVRRASFLGAPEPWDAQVGDHSQAGYFMRRWIAEASMSLEQGKYSGNDIRCLSNRRSRARDIS
ncbi:hypothetical protein C8R45DRAFT_974227 [Mycena sanguinolenta]|nr:hypothetical protein C8R45DRAFT_974227 [Mycena sanguinolenta]